MTTTGDDAKVGMMGSSQNPKRWRYPVAGLLVGAALVIGVIVASELAKQPMTASAWGVVGFIVLAILLVILAAAALRGSQPPPKSS